MALEYLEYCFISNVSLTFFKTSPYTGSYKPELQAYDFISALKQVEMGVCYIYLFSVDVMLF